MRLGTVAAILLACSPAWSTPSKKKPPTPTTNPAQDEINALQKELSDLQMKQANFPAAKVARKLYEAQKKLSGEDAQLTQNRKAALANALHTIGDDASSARLHKEMVATAERLHGPESREVLNALQMLDGIYFATVNYEEIEPNQRRIIAIEKVLVGDKSTEYAQQLSLLGAVYWNKGEYSSADNIEAEVLAIYEANAKGDADPQVLGALQAYANLLWQTNQMAKAQALFDKMIKLAEKSTDTAMATMFMNSVESIYHFTGHDDLAVPIRKKLVDLYTKEIARLAKTPDDFRYAQMISSLGTLYQQAEDWPNAEKWLQVAIDRDEKVNHFSGYMQALAEVKLNEGKAKEALALYERADTELKAISKGANTMGYGMQIATTLVELGDYKRATEILEKYLEAFAKTTGKKFPGYGMLEGTLAGMYLASGNVPKAETLMSDSMEIAETELATLLKAGTEADHAIYFKQHAYTLDSTINFNVKFAPKSASAARIALTTLLRRKGRVLDAAAASLSNLRKQLSADDKQLLDDLASARNQLAKLEVAGPAATGGDDYAKAVSALEDKIQKLEVEVGKKSAAYRVVSQRVELATVQKQIPKDARLVELVNYQVFDKPTPNAKNKSPRHYAAYILAPTGDPQVVDLGPEAPINTAIEAFRKALSDPKNTKVMDLGHALYDLTMAKIAPKLGGATNLLIAPDGGLDVIPFSALVDGNQEFLVKKYQFTYLTSGRDLLRVSARAKAAGGGVIFADPNFDGDKKPKKAGDGTRGTRSTDLSSLMWPALPGTGQEADAVGKAMAGFKVFRGTQATETAVKALHGPRILHLATHGFFLPDEEAPKGAGGTTPVAYENPLLRSGLAFAGANNLRSGDDDGILTALEASGLDLEGTQLVVMSACETGVGKVTNGDGVYGLRRALVIAGAGTLVMSLWQVDDQATKDLMAGYYGHLKAGRGKSAALRDIQLEMLKKPGYAHPFYWASFLPAGNDAPL